jgi:hypothetical protein
MLLGAADRCGGAVSGTGHTGLGDCGDRWRARVCAEPAEFVPGAAEPAAAPATEPGLLRRLLLVDAHLLTHARDRTETACTLHGIVIGEPRVSGWLTGLEAALPTVRLAERGPGASPADPRLLRLLRVLTGHRAPVRSVAWSPDGDRLVTVGAYDTTVRIWDTRTWEQEHRLDIRGASLDTVVWSPDGRRLAVLGKSDRFPGQGEYDADDIHGWESRIEHVRMVLGRSARTWPPSPRRRAVRTTARWCATGSTSSPSPPGPERRGARRGRRVADGSARRAAPAPRLSRSGA